MFNNFKIDHSNLTNSSTIINYDDSRLKRGGYKLMYVVNPKNIVYSQVINECKIQKKKVSGRCF